MSPPSARRIGAARVVGGLISVTAGALLLPRPLTTLALSPWLLAASLLAAAMLALRIDRRTPKRWLAALALLAVAVAVAAAGVRVLPLVPVAVSCAAAANAVRLVLLAALRRESSVTRLTHAVWGLASASGAVVLWLWPDATLLLLAWTIAAGLVVGGLVMAWRGIRTEPHIITGRRRGLRLVGALLIAGLASSSAAISLHAASGVPAPDAFYSWPGPLPDQPGALLRVAPTTARRPRAHVRCESSTRRHAPTTPSRSPVPS